MRKDLTHTLSQTKAKSQFHFIVDNFFQSRLALTGALLLLMIIVLALFANILSPQDPYDLKSLDIMDAHQPPGGQSMAGTMFILGTDTLGRDLFSAILYGLRTSLTIGGISTLIAMVIGTTLGLIAGWSGGWIETFFMRLADLQLSLPAILVALVLISMTGPGKINVIIALILVQWAVYARTVRNVVLSVMQKDYVTAARGLALSSRWILFVHVLPNCLPPLIVLATVSVAGAITLEATLSFLGIGLPVTQPSLGLLIANGFSYLMSGHYWISVFPGIALLLTIMSINLVGDRLREVINPKQVR
jgi:peptide/nickel transport system permease protein